MKPFDTSLAQVTVREFNSIQKLWYIKYLDLILHLLIKL